MKKALLLIVLFCVLFLNSSIAQHFEWAASMGKAQTETLSAVTDAEGNLTMVLSWQQASISYAKFDELYCIFDAFGDTIRLENNRPAMLVLIQFNKQGKLNWYKVIASRRNDYVAETAFLTCAKNGNVSLFINAGGNYYINDFNFEYLIEEGDFIRNEAPKATNPNGDGDEEKDDEDDYYNDRERLLDKWTGTIQMDFKPSGELVRLSRLFSHNRIELQGVVAHADGGNILTGFVSDKSITIGKTTISELTAGATVILKTDSMGTLQWVQAIKYLAKSCCTIYDSKIAQSPNGTTFIAGMGNYGIEFPDGKKEEFEAKPEHTKYNPPSQSFLLALDKTGKVLWHKMSGAKNYINALLVNDKTIFISGSTAFTNSVFGTKADTAEGRKGYIMALDAKKGKAQWLHSNTSGGFGTMAQDNAGNVYGLGEYTGYKSGLATNSPAYFETDTLPRRCSQALLATYDSKGKYRWVKGFSGMLYDNSQYFKLFADDCNNLFIAGSIFASLKIPNQYIDGAFMKGEAYGSMAYLSKIKNNTNRLDTNALVKQAPADSNTLFAFREVQGEAIKGQAGCGVSPGPWQMVVYPNPFSADATVKINTTYDDDAVSILVMDLNGRQLGTLLSGKQLKKGTYEYPINTAAFNLSWGTYLIVLRGSATILSERVVYR
jgi:hypothetical protein